MTDGIALDFGSGWTRIAEAGSGALLYEEPTVAAVDRDTARLVAFGTSCYGLIAASAGRVARFRPVRHGQLVDLDLAEEVLAEAISQSGGSRFHHGRAVVAVHLDTSNVQRRAFSSVLRRSGVRNVKFVPVPLLDALGAGLPFDEPRGTMVVDVGAGVTDVGIVALGGVVTGRAIAVGAESFDAVIRAYLLRRHGLSVDEQTASAVRAAIGTLEQRAEEAGVEVVGRSVETGRPTTAIVARSELVPVLSEVAKPLLEAATECVALAPPELGNDLLGDGLLLTGGGSLLPGLGARLGAVTGIPVHLSSEHGRLAVRGASTWLERPSIGSPIRESVRR